MTPISAMPFGGFSRPPLWSQSHGEVPLHRAGSQRPTWGRGSPWAMECRGVHQLEVGDWWFITYINLPITMVSTWILNILIGMMKKWFTRCLNLIIANGFQLGFVVVYNNPVSLQESLIPWLIEVPFHRWFRKAGWHHIWQNHSLRWQLFILVYFGSSPKSYTGNTW